MTPIVSDQAGFDLPDMVQNETTASKSEQAVAVTPEPPTLRDLYPDKFPTPSGMTSDEWHKWHFGKIEEADG